MNDLFEGDPTPEDKLVYVKLTEQAANNTKVQLANSPNLAKEIMGAVMDALTAHTAMSKQALQLEQLRAEMKDVLLGTGRLWEGLRRKASPPGARL